PVVFLDRRLEAARDVGGLAAAGQVGDQEAELVSAAARVQVAPFRAPLDRQKVLRSDLIREDPSDPFDDAVADGMTERVVVPLEAVDVDDADDAPSDTRFGG